MKRRDRRTNVRHQLEQHRNLTRWAAIKRDGDRLSPNAIEPQPATAGEALQFGRFRVLLRQRQLLADGVPVELGTRALDVLLILLEADGSLVTKEELLSRVWPGIVVVEENLKFQICALRRVLGPDRDLIRTEVGRGYRFTGIVCSDATVDPDRRPMRSRAPFGQFYFAQSGRQSLWCNFCSAGISDFSNPAPRLAQSSARSRIFPADLALAGGFAGRGCLTSGMPLVEENPSARDPSALSRKAEEM